MLLDATGYLDTIGEGLEDAHTLRAELQVDGALGRQREPLVPRLARALHHHHTSYYILQTAVVTCFMKTGKYVYSDINLSA